MAATAESRERCALITRGAQVYRLQRPTYCRENLVEGGYSWSARLRDFSLCVAALAVDSKFKPEKMSLFLSILVNVASKNSCLP